MSEDSWATLLGDDITYGQVIDRAVDGRVSPEGRCQIRYSDNPVPEMTHGIKALYYHNQARVDRGVEAAVNNYRVNAFFLLLDHINDKG